tara:strand:+ start:570 stop:836 length:267 start_codon:yes stop_codon:yes gene_type:complete
MEYIEDMNKVAEKLDVKEFAEKTYEAVTERKRNVQEEADKEVKERESVIYTAKRFRNGTMKSLGMATQFFIRESIEAFMEGYNKELKK